MNRYLNGEAIRMFREKKKMTQAELAGKIGVTDKAVSKWETGRGLPDITLVESIAEALGLSIGELFAGEQVINRNVKSNMKEARLYVCPICGNKIESLRSGGQFEALFRKLDATCSKAESDFAVRNPSFASSLLSHFHLPRLS